MKREGSRRLGRHLRAMAAVTALPTLAWWLASDASSGLVNAFGPQLQESVPNNHLMRNPGGKAATLSTRGSVDQAARNLTGGQELFNNKRNPAGRTCNACHNSANNGSKINKLRLRAGGRPTT